MVKKSLLVHVDNDGWGDDPVIALVAFRTVLDRVGVMGVLANQEGREMVFDRPQFVADLKI